MEPVRTMPDVVWAVNWAVLGLLFAAWAARRAWVQHRIARRELAAVRSYEELREGEYASIGGTAGKQPGGRAFDVVMGNDSVRVERAKLDLAERADEILAVDADRPVYVSGIVERAAGGGFAIRAVPGQRMAVATEPLWQRAARRRLAHLLIAFVIAGASVALFRFLAWDTLRLTLDGAKVRATLSNLRDIDEERFDIRDIGFRKVRRTQLDATYVDEKGATRHFTPVVDPDTEWLWSLRADQAEVQRLGIEPVEQWFVILPHDPSVYRLGERVRLGFGAGFGPLALFALTATLYWLILVRPETWQRHRSFHYRIVTPQDSAA